MAEDTRDCSQPQQESNTKTCAQEIAIPEVETANKEEVDCQNVTEKNNSDSSNSHGMIDNSNLRYEGEVCIYTDPSSKYEYIWSTDKNEWVLRSGTEKASYRSDGNSNEKCEIGISRPNNETLVGKSTDESGDTSKDKPSNERHDYEFDGESYCYKDTRTGMTYKYDNAQQKWVIKEQKQTDVEKDSDESDDDSKDRVIKQDMSKGTYGYEGDTHTYTDPTDGTVYIWDREKNAWFPKVDEDFLAHYQMNYGFTDNSVSSSVEKEAKAEEKIENAEDKLALKRKAPQEPNWFEMDDQHNTKVYVSSLPLDITEQEFLDVMQKCGMVMKDAETGKMKIKLYSEPGTNQLKGDGLCSYIKIESVELALKLLDGYNLRGHKLHVERAKFQMKGSYDPKLKPKKLKKKDKDKLRKMQEKLFDWRPDKLRGERSKHESVVIVKNLFESKVFDKDVSLILEYQQDLREECSKCGDVKKVIIYDRHPEGVAQINFREPEAADACVALLNGRWFGQRKITAETWDGKTKYKIVETEAEVQQRLQKWEKFLESEEANKNKSRKDKAEGSKEMESGMNIVKSNDSAGSVETNIIKNVKELDNAATVERNQSIDTTSNTNENEDK